MPEDEKVERAGYAPATRLRERLREASRFGAAAEWGEDPECLEFALEELRRAARILGEAFHVWKMSTAPLDTGLLDTFDPEWMRAIDALDDRVAAAERTLPEGFVEMVSLSREVRENDAEIRRQIIREVGHELGNRGRELIVLRLAMLCDQWRQLKHLVERLGAELEVALCRWRSKET